MHMLRCVLSPPFNPELDHGPRKGADVLSSGISQPYDRITKTFGSLDFEDRDDL